jgi:hypothetical protein
MLSKTIKADSQPLLLAEERVPAEPSGLRLMQSSSFQTDTQHFVSIFLAMQKQCTLDHLRADGGRHGSVKQSKGEGSQR